MAVQLRLKAMNRFETVLPQFKEMDLNLHEYEDFLNTIFVRVPIDYDLTKYQMLVRLVKKAEKELGRSILILPEQVELFQIEPIHKGEQ